MSDIECFGCLQNQKNSALAERSEEEQTYNPLEPPPNLKLSETLPSLGSTAEAKIESESEFQMFFQCRCCEHTYCLRCCEAHIRVSVQQSPTPEQSQKTEENEVKEGRFKTREQKIKNDILVVCQECEEDISAKYCGNCGQYLCEKCSYKIHNKGKRAKHSLETTISRNLSPTRILLLTPGISGHLKALSEEGISLEQNFERVIDGKGSRGSTLLLLEQTGMNELAELPEDHWFIDDYQPQSLKYEDLISLRSKHPFAWECKILLLSQECPFRTSLQQEYSAAKSRPMVLQFHQQWTKLQGERKHERVLSEKVTIKHNKNISNFSNLSAISKIEHQSYLSNDPSDLFESNQLNNDNTFNQSSSILMGALSDCDKEEKDEKDEKDQRKDPFGHNRIYSIREENSHNSANISISTENSNRRRNRKRPIGYLQPLRGTKEQSRKAEDYLRQLARKGILMIREQKAQAYIRDAEVSRTFMRNIGQKEIKYVAYIINELTVEVLSWVIESIKEDKMTPNEKLVQSRLKQSFDFKVTCNVWNSIVKYLQSSEYQQDFKKDPYIYKITVVKYGEEVLLEFDNRKWAYEDQELLDETEVEWNQFKQLITVYFNSHDKITGGRYGCVQYVKLNGQKPLRNCSLGKLSLYVQEAINKGIIRYHKTLLVSNSQYQNASFTSQVGPLDQTAQWAQVQRQLKIMRLQLALVEMFQSMGNKVPISLAQIPLYLNSKIIFEYTFVELGFPKLKNILQSLDKKLLLSTNRTHVIYEVTNSGNEAIESMNKRCEELNDRFLAYVLDSLASIIMHMQSLSLNDLYMQLTMRLGCPFDHKLMKFPDFHSFVLYYCSGVATMQYFSNTIMVSINYNAHNYNAQSYNYNYNGHYAYGQAPLTKSYYQEPPQTPYNLYHSSEFPKESLKKCNDYQKTHSREDQLRPPTLNFEDIDLSSPATTTPKFSNPFQHTGGRERIGSVGWADFLQEDTKQEKEEEQPDENYNRQIGHIINIIDDGEVSASRPKTVIVKEGKEQLLFCHKLEEEELDSFGGDAAVWVDDQKDVASNSKHTRFKSTNEVPNKHNRQYSTANTRK